MINFNNNQKYNLRIDNDYQHFPGVNELANFEDNIKNMSQELQNLNKFGRNSGDRSMIAEFMVKFAQS
jgi:hypothetical protein